MSHSIDYFAVLGKQDAKLQFENVKNIWEENKYYHPSEVWNDAITDIAVVTEHNRGSIDDSWEIITQSIEGIEFKYTNVKISLAFRRRRVSKRLDHISQVCKYQIASSDHNCFPLDL